MSAVSVRPRRRRSCRNRRELSWLPEIRLSSRSTSEGRLRRSQIFRGVPEELRGVPEELRSVPEELRGVPEELRSVPEELRSVPEELRGVPEECSGPLPRPPGLPADATEDRAVRKLLPAARVEDG